MVHVCRLDEEYACGYSVEGGGGKMDVFCCDNLNHGLFFFINPECLFIIINLNTFDIVLLHVVFKCCEGSLNYMDLT